jgi:hypothetical protein
MFWPDGDSHSTNGQVLCGFANPHRFVGFPVTTGNQSYDNKNSD